MLRTILDDVKASGFQVQQVIMDHDTSGGNIACSVFLEVRISYCGNHTTKSFHRDLMKIKSVHCKVIIKFIIIAAKQYHYYSAHHHAS